MLSHSGDICPDEVMKYERSPYPPSLFEAKHRLRAPDKVQLLDAIRNHVSSSDGVVLQSNPKTDHYVLHRLKWSTYSYIADTYAHFTFDLYARPPLDTMEDQVQRTVHNVELLKLQIRSTYPMQQNMLGRRAISYHMI